MEREIDRLLPDVWRLIRTGFVTRWERSGDGHVAAGSAVHVGGFADLDRAEALTVHVLFRGLSGAPANPRRAVLELLRSETFSHAVTVEDAAIKELGADDIDRAIDAEVALRGVEVAPAIGGGEGIEVYEVGALREVARAAIEKLPEDCKSVAQKRWTEGKSDADTARELGIGRAAVRARERRIRHHVRHALRHTTHQTIGAASIDHLICGTAVPAITMQRIRRTIASKLQPVEPRPFAERLRWALGAAALALIGAVVLAVFGAPGR